MANLQQHLSVFKPLLTSLLDTNLAIAGMHSLELHGLNTGRETSDLDIVIFKPTKLQMSALKSLEFFRVLHTGKADYGIDDAVSVKFTKDGLTIDFLLETDKDTPADLLLFEMEGTTYKVQSVANTIAAKASFLSDTDKSKCRLKDAKDFMALKNLNFNF